MTVRTLPPWLLLGGLALFGLAGAVHGIQWAGASLETGERRLVAAAVVVLVYLAFTGAVLHGHRRRARTARAKARALVSPAGAAAAPPLLVTYASQTGFAERLAWETAAVLQAAGTPARVEALAALDAGTLEHGGRALFVVSTTGEGDAPDQAAGFVRKVMGRPALPLAGLRYGLLALGDRSYAKYCGFGRALDHWLQEQGAERLFPRIEVSDGDAIALAAWRREVGHLCGSGPEGDWPAVRYGRWRLVERRLLNPGSAGWPCYHLALDPAERSDLVWQAGDIAEVLVPPDRPGRAALCRDYSIASVPQEGTLHLLVRQMHDAAGRPGGGSGWLTQRVRLGGEIAMRVRRNPGFHGPADDRPLLLIGNGTGLAGLRAHLRARAGTGARHWLVFGERNAACDYFYRAEIEAWQAAGTLSRVDLAFSRDQPERIYVQHRLLAAGDAVRRWVLCAGAAIYVCGSARGMASAVDAALAELLGRDRLERLAEDGRYRRDVY